METSLNDKNKDFFQQVHQVVVLIPKGRVTSYGAIAKYLGAVRGSRMVGWSMKAAHNKPEIPAHRVVNRLGQLTGKHNFSSPTAMEELLKQEGVVVNEDQIQNFPDVFWDPSIEIKEI